MGAGPPPWVLLLAAAGVGMWLPAVIRVLGLLNAIRYFSRCTPVLLLFGGDMGAAVATQSRCIQCHLTGVPDGLVGTVAGTWAAHTNLPSAGASLGSIPAGGKVAVTCCPRVTPRAWGAKASGRSC